MTSAIVLSGGRSTRMGTDKSSVTVAGRTLLERTIDALVGCSAVIVVGPALELRPANSWPTVQFTLEDPPFGGPAAGIAAGVALVSSEETFLLPCDLAHPGPVVDTLRQHELGPDGTVLQDTESWPQYLHGRYRTAALRKRLAMQDDLHNLSVRRLLHGLDVHLVPVPDQVNTDLDTPEDVRAHSEADQPRP